MKKSRGQCVTSPTAVMSNRNPIASGRAKPTSATWRRCSAWILKKHQDCIVVLSSMLTIFRSFVTMIMSRWTRQARSRCLRPGSIPSRILRISSLSSVKTSQNNRVIDGEWRGRWIVVTNMPLPHVYCTRTVLRYPSFLAILSAVLFITELRGERIQKRYRIEKLTVSKATIDNYRELPVRSAF